MGKYGQEKKRPRVLVWDLEFKATENWKKELKIYPGYLICFACKELDKPGMTVLSRRQFPGKDVLDDKKLVKAIGDRLRGVDLHVFQYGTKIDFRFIQTKLMQYGFPPLPEPPNFVDTCTVARQKLSLLSNSMRVLAKFFGLEEKKKIEHEDWYRAFSLDKKILPLVEKRCASDVRLTEQIYKRLRPLIHNHPSIREYPDCSACGFTRYKPDGYRVTSKGRLKRLCCLNCGTWSTMTIKQFRVKA